MGDTALKLGVNFTSITCGNCGGTYALASNYYRDCRKKGKSWNCPYCEIGWGFDESEVDKLKRKLNSEKKKREWAENRADRAREAADREAKRAAGYKGAFTKAKKRVGKGVCPCCNRHFEDLRRHMKSKHPDYSDEEPEPDLDHSRTCGAETMDGSPCERHIAGAADRCWQHRR